MKLFINNQYIYICKNQKVIFRSNNSLKVGYSKTNLFFSIFSSFKLSKFRKKKSYHDILHNFFYQGYFFQQCYSVSYLILKVYQTRTIMTM